jgi:rod shape-determining protein MreC
VRLDERGPSLPTKDGIARLSAVLAVGVVLLALSPLPIAGDLEARAGAAIAPAAGALRDLARPVADVVLRAGQLRELTAENAALRNRVSRLEGDLATLREQQIAVEQAAALLDAVGPNARQFTPAAVVLRDPAPGRQLLLLDRGREDGVAVGQPVLSSGATLAGVVIEVGARRSRVRLIIDRDAAVAGVVQSSRTPGAAVGTGAAIRLDFVPLGAAVTAGDLVLTSALGGQLPRGLLIGRVSAVAERPEELFAAVDVEPLADFLRLEHVLVMTGFTPGTVLGGDGETREGGQTEEGDRAEDGP